MVLRRSDFESSGYAVFQSAVSETQVETLREDFSAGEAGKRIYEATGEMRNVIESGALALVARQVLGEASRPVRAILFDKTADVNWTLGWHQDRVLAVKRRWDVAGFGNWTTKWGAVHVEPPFAMIERMATLRLHCDPCADENGPLEVIEGSHCLGRLSEPQVAETVRTGRATALICGAGDAILLSTPIVHRSRKSRSAARRRVLQVDYAAFDLPAPLEWAYRLADAA